jgi:hypothetical protein
MAIKGRIFFRRFFLIPRTARRSSGRRKPPRLFLSSTTAFATASEIPGRPDISWCPARLISTSCPRRYLCRTVSGPSRPPLAASPCEVMAAISPADFEDETTLPGEDACGATRSRPEAHIFHTRMIRDRRRTALGSLSLLPRDDPPGLPELVPDSVDQGLPGRFDDVVRDTDGPPLGFLVPGPYQNPYRGPRAPRA